MPSSTMQDPPYTDSDYEEDVKPHKKRARGGPGVGKPRKTAEPWTPEQDVVLIDAATAILKSNLWAAVKADSKVAGRGSTGVNVRMGVLLKRMKQGGASSRTARCKAEPYEL